MEYRRLGNCGTKVSAISLGAWTTFGESVTDIDLAKSIFRAAYDAGVNFFDAADIYAVGAAEEMMGKILAGFPRHTLVISSKVFWPMSDDVNDRGLSRKHIMESVGKSLRRLSTDYLDIYFCHRFDPETPVEEIVRAMDDLIHQGKVLYWGTSQWTGAQIAEAYGLARQYNLYPPQVEQPQYSMLVRERVELDVLPAAEQRGIGLVVWSPLAMGVLTGKYDDGMPEGSRMARVGWLRDQWIKPDTIGLVRRLKPIADELGVSRAHLALAWVLRQQGVSSAITGATKVEHITSNVEAVGLKLDAEVLDKIDETLGNKPEPPEL